MSCARPVRHLLSLLTLYFVAAYASAQPQFNLSVLNGLPSDHVYFLLKDHNGYLWIATEKGVLRYNGYTLKKFGLEDGLSNDDVWHLYEDRKGRIWLGTIASEMGYIENDRFHAPHIDNPAGRVLQSHDYREAPSGITFTIPTEDFSNDVYMERQDSLINLTRLIDWKAYFAYNGQALLVYPRDSAFSLFLRNGLICKKKIAYKPAFTGDHIRVPLADWLFLYNRQNSRITICSTHDTAIRELFLFSDSTEHIYTSFLREQKIYFVTNKHFYRCDTGFRIEKKYAHTDLFPGNTASHSTFVNLLEDDFWGTCVTTTDNGIYMGNRSHPFTKIVTGLPMGSRYVGSTDDSSHFWYDPVGNSMLCVDGQFRLLRKRWMGLGKVLNIQPVTSDSALVFSTKGLYWFDRRSNSISEYFKGTSVFASESVRHTEKTYMPWPGAVIRNGVYDKGRLYAQQVGLSEITARNDTAMTRQVIPQRLTSMVCDSFRRAIWLYNEKNIFFLPIGGAPFIIDKNVLEYAGIRKTEKIIVDNQYGNVFIKDHGRLYLYDGRSPFPKLIFPGHNLENAQVCLRGNKLVAAGSMGVLYSEVSGPGMVSEPVCYSNLKKVYYNTVIDLVVSGAQVLVNTDKGCYIVHTDKEKPAALQQEALLLVRYREKLFPAKDPLELDQDHLLLQLDVINPSGTGTLRYRYRLEGDSSWKEQRSAEVYLPGLEPGARYTLSVVALDDVWISKPFHLQLYVVPYWWQTGIGRKAILLGGLIVVAFLVALAVYLTGRKAARKHAQRQVQLELHNLRLETELKKVYAQMNPHFIFNTLSTTAYFVKKNNIREANRHIVLFSRLLRSYLKSARSKLIALEEELRNTDDYIQLQQARFGDKFEYNITVDPLIDAATFKVPPMLIQPLVENAINHGLLHKENKGLLRIIIVAGASVNEVVITIDDDGIGREAARQYQVENGTRRDSYGSSIIDQLIATFNAHEEAHIGIEYTDKQLPLTGTTVTLTIKHHP